MLRHALESGRLDASSTRKAEALLGVLRSANSMYVARSPVAREMASLQHNVTSWVRSAALDHDSLAHTERPSAAAAATAVPPHVRKMLRRYEGLRTELLRLARSPSVADRRGAHIAASHVEDEERGGRASDVGVLASVEEERASDLGQAAEEDEGEEAEEEEEAEAAWLQQGPSGPSRAASSPPRPSSSLLA